MKEKKMNNKGFSLVELIIVIAIMAVLVGILAPQYLKFLTNSKVSTDITNAQEIATVVNTLIADSKLTGTTVTLDKTDAVPALADVDTDEEYVMYNIGKAIAPKYNKDAQYIVTYSIDTGVSKIEYSFTNGGTTVKYEAYPNPDNATDGMNAKLKK